MGSVSAGVGLPIAFVAVGLAFGAVIGAAGRLRGSLGKPGGRSQTPRRIVISRAIAILIVGSVVALANVNAFPGVPARSLVAWVVIVLIGCLPLIGAWWLLLQYVRQRVGPSEFQRMVDTARPTRPVLPPGTRTVKIVFVVGLITIVSGSALAFQFALDHVVF
jgi:hypothetical protein